MADELKRLERRLKKEYAQAEKDMRKKLNKFKEQFAAKDKEKAAQLARGSITPEEYKKWRMSQLLQSKWMNDMLGVYANDQTRANQRAAEIIAKVLPNTFAENANYATYEIEKALNINTSFTLYSKDAVAKLTKDNPKLLPKPRVNIPKDRAWNQRKMRSAITQGILQGESVDRIATRLMGVTDMNATAALRNARTMVGSAESMGKLEAYERASGLGIKLKKTWVATLDDRVRDSHAELDGETVAIDEPFSNGLMCPRDPDGEPAEVYNCRCTMIAQIDGYERDTSDLNLRNTDHFPYKSYKDWKTAHGTLKEVDSLGKKKGVHIGRRTPKSLI